MIDFTDVIICPATVSDSVPPTFDEPSCQPSIATDIDPQADFIWVRTAINLSKTRGPNGEPLSLYISGKMSSLVYLNGTYVGANGLPAVDRTTEVPGKMDVELYPKQDLFHVGENEVVLQMSSHHGFIQLHRPLHIIGIAPSGLYANPTSHHFNLSLVTLGLFLLGGIYFGVMAMIGTSPIRSASLSLICIFAGGQLVSESLRTLVAYSYPVHDLRLMAITAFSVAFGLSVAFHIFQTFTTGSVWRWVLGLAALSLIAVVLTKGFDFKALIGMTIPLAGALVATGYWTHRARPRAFIYFIALLVFMLSIGSFQGLFLDTVFFLLVAFFLLLLFLEQALVLAEEERERHKEEARANRLEQALASIEERDDAQHLNLKSAGKIERIATNQIVHCKGAGGYSELTLSDGRTVLHSLSLNDLEETLPATFLRVHRSFLVNVTFIQTLTRATSGTGVLVLSDDSEVPVSRRVMPKVREALA
ncbi:MAG: LytTR family DNA-binding domain-containing protein [Pseudomonadota bacterium]